MGYYSYSSSQSYIEYLRDRRSVEQITDAVSAGSRDIVLSIEHCENQWDTVAEAVASVKDSLSEGFDRVEAALEDIGSSINELRSVCLWGFSELLLSLGRMNDTLDELLRVSKTPAQTWATEQFEIARDAIRRKLFAEALQALDRAIHGHGSNAGYQLDFRFHQMKGIILLGSFTNNDPTVLDPESAEQSFLRAARFAQHDFPLEAARSQLCAGWAAYVQGKVDRAADHTQAALRLDPSLAEAHFQLAKCLMHLRDPITAASPLARACELDRYYTLRAGADDDFKRFEQETNAVLFSLRDQWQKRALDALAAAEVDFVATSRLNCGRYRLLQLIRLDAAIGKLNEVRTLTATNTLFGAQDGLALCEEARALLADARIRFKAAARDQAERNRKDALIRVSAARVRVQKASTFPRYFLGFLFASLIPAILVSSSLISRWNEVAYATATPVWLNELRARGYDRQVLHGVTVSRYLSWDDASRILNRPIPGYSFFDASILWINIVIISGAVGIVVGKLVSFVRTPAATDALIRAEVILQDAEATLGQVEALIV